MKLVGVRILGDWSGGKEVAEEVSEVIRKSKSTKNLIIYSSPPAIESSADNNGYLHDGGLIQCSLKRHGQRGREMRLGLKREHRTFRTSLKMLGKRD